MKRWIPVAVIVVLGIAAGIVYVESTNRPEWTTSSPEALSEFQMAMDAMMKIYHTEARQHLERALELDPDFVMARIILAQENASMGHEESLEELRKLVNSVDLSRLNPRERFMVKLTRARLEGASAEADAIVSRYLVQHPEDPYALEIEARTYWSRGDLERARELFTRLVKVSPNWVVGYNSLGYICMEEGEFDQSEEYFSTYRFIAPDQANPYDSTGELFILTGRWEEARENLLKAIQVKPDFCASHEKLVLVDLLLEDEPHARTALQKMEAIPACTRGVKSARCRILLWPLLKEHLWREVLAVSDGQDCYPESISAYRAAAMLGDFERCDAIEATLRGRLEKMESPLGRSVVTAQLHHMEGIRAAVQGDHAAAIDAFRRADGLLTWRGVEIGFLKLINLETLAEVQLASGDTAGSAATLATLRKVNPRIAEWFEKDTYRPLGLSAARSPGTGEEVKTSPTRPE